MSVAAKQFWKTTVYFGDPLRTVCAGVSMLRLRKQYVIGDPERSIVCSRERKRVIFCINPDTVLDW